MRKLQPGRHGQGLRVTQDGPAGRVGRALRIASEACWSYWMGLCFATDEPCGSSGMGQDGSLGQ